MFQIGNMLVQLFLFVFLCTRVVRSSSIFGGNAYGYTASSWCGVYNGCLAQVTEDDEGRMRTDKFTSMRYLSIAWANFCYVTKENVEETKTDPNLMQIHHYKNGDVDFYEMKKFFHACDKNTLTNAERKKDCTKIKSDDNIWTKIKEVFKFQVLPDNSAFQNTQGAIWKTPIHLKGKMRKHFNNLKLKCNAECELELRQICVDVYIIRHVKDWCLHIHTWVFSSTKLDKYQHYLLRLVQEYVSMYVHSPTGEESAVLVSAALSTVFITTEMFSGTTDIAIFQNLPYYVIHSLFLATYVGRLRITLQHRDNTWKTGGVRVAASDVNIEAASNFEGVTGSVYASLAALFSNKRKDALKLRFRPEIHELNSIGCIEQTIGMVFIRPGDWIPDQVEWKTIGPTEFSPAGMLAVATDGEESTLEISEGGLTLYPVTIGALLISKEESVCNSKTTMGNGNATHATFDLRGLGGICNWVPTW